MPAWHPADDACIRGAASACVAPGGVSLLL
jgi:hypothetical protein